MTTDEFFAARAANLAAGALGLLETEGQQTATQLRTQLRAGMRELDRVLQQLRKDGQIRSYRRRWERVS